MIALLRFWFDIVMAFVAPRAALVAENLILRQQLIVIRRQIKRPRPRRFDRWLIGALAGRLHRLMDVVLLVKPETVIGWHRAAWRLLWRWRSHRPPGRPPLMQICGNSSGGCGARTPPWGQQIIAAELAKLGYQISPRTVAKYRPSGLDRQRGQRWTTFIRNHLHETWACDFFVLVTGKLLAYRKRMGWSFNWASSYHNDFNFDFGVSATERAPQMVAPLLKANEVGLGAETSARTFWHVGINVTASYEDFRYGRAGFGLETLARYFPRRGTARDQCWSRTLRHLRSDRRYEEWGRATARRGSPLGALPCKRGRR